MLTREHPLWTVWNVEVKFSQLRQLRRVRPVRQLNRLHGAFCLWTLTLAVPAASPAQDVVISEFLALNRSGLTDADGDRSDWIELSSLAKVPVDLEGWYLTDDRSALRMWRLPPVLLEPGGSLVIFASGKDRDDPEAELHTNFRLGGDGEYLALVRPDGDPAHEYAPRYPPQVEDVSYGLVHQVKELVSAGMQAEILIPTHGALGTDWTLPGFVPGADWLVGPTGVGFVRQGAAAPPPGLVAYFSFDGSLDDQAGSHDGTFRGAGQATFTEGHDGILPGAARFDGIDDYVEVTQGAGLPLFNMPAFSVALWVKGPLQADKRVFSEGSGSNNSPVFNIGVDVSGTTGKVDIFIRDESGGRMHSHTLSSGVAFDDTWHHLAWADDGGDATLYIDGVPDATDFSYSKRPLPLDRTSIGAILRAASSFHFQGSIDDVSLWNRLLEPEEVAALAAGETPLTLATASFERLIATDLEASMLGVQASAYLRIPFVVDSPVRIDALSLSMYYDDGFVLHLNGVEAARRNAPQAVDWDSRASVERAGSEGSVAESLNLTSHAELLQLGQNVLAVHGLNGAPDDDEFLVLPELLASSFVEGEGRYFIAPTPGAPNNGGVIDFVADTKFSVDRGFCTEPFRVEISCATEGAEIRYTLDGSAPAAESGLVYGEPILVETTTVLRAAAFKDGFQPTNVDTLTYIFPEDVLRQTAPVGYPDVWAGVPADYAMDPEIVENPRYSDSMVDSLLAIPTLSLAMDVASLFGPSGLYDHPRSSGRAWERPASAELIRPDGRDGFQIDAGLRIMGNRSRDPAASPKHGLRLIFRREYGARKLEFPLFSDSPVERFDTLALRPNAFDSWVSPDSGQRRGAQYVRDQWVRNAQRDSGQLTAHSFFVHLYLNGLYWGLYSLVERPDASFAAEYLGGDKENYDAIKTHEEVVDGNIDAYRELDLLRGTNLATPQGYAAMREYLHVENMIDYMIVNMFAPSTDWPGNYYMVRERRNGAGFHFVSWDSEYAFLGGVDNNRTSIHWRDADSPTKFYHALKVNAEFRLLFADHLHRHLFNGGVLTPEAVDRLWMENAGEVELALLAESARWGDYRRSVPYTPDSERLAEEEYLRTQYFPRRSAIVLEQFRAQGMYPQLDAPVFNQHGGRIEAGFRLVLEAESGIIHYTMDGSDPRLEGGGVSPAARVFAGGDTVELLESTRVRARVLEAGRWSALGDALFTVDSGLRVTEVQYHPPPPPEGSPFAREDFEFIELQNLGTSTLDLSGVRLATGVEFDFTGVVTALAPREIVVVVENLQAFASRYDLTATQVAGQYRGRLRNEGEDIALVGPLGETILEFSYDDRWYPETDGQGPSLVNADPRTAVDAWGSAANWRPSSYPFGSPGLDESAGGRQLPGDVNQDGRLDISDAVGLLGHLFLGAPEILPCAGGTLADEGNRLLLDVNSDAGVNLTDAVQVLAYLFQGGPPPALGTACIPIPGCPDACGP